MNLVRLPLMLLAGSMLAQGFPPARSAGTDTIVQLLQREARFTPLPEAQFNQLGWRLPDGGRRVWSLAEAAPRGAFDPRALESLSPEELGYRARWHVLRYPFYGLEWDITALELQPRRPLEGLPALAVVHGGSANWYEFFVDPLNGPGIGQYLAQKVPVFLINIPGNYKPGGWTAPNSERIPQYLVDREIPAEEAKIRNSIFTFRLIAEGVRRLLEEVSSGPLLIVGHSTGGELQFMLKDSSLSPRLRDLSLGWGSGPPAFVKKRYDEQLGIRRSRVERFGELRVWQARGRSAEGYVSAGYVGPLNPLSGESELEVAQAWFERVGRRRPHFKQTLQDIEHQGMVEHAARLEQEIREVLNGNPYGIHAAEVINDLFSPSRSPLPGYRKMVWVVARLDKNHWNPDNPRESLEVFTAEQFQKANRGVPIRVLLLDAPITHYGHIERAAQVAEALLAAALWLNQ